MTILIALLAFAFGAAAMYFATKYNIVSTITTDVKSIETKIEELIAHLKSKEVTITSDVKADVTTAKTDADTLKTDIAK